MRVVIFVISFMYVIKIELKSIADCQFIDNFSKINMLCFFHLIDVIFRITSVFVECAELREG